MSKKSTYERKTDRLNRSFENQLMEIRDPYKALAAAIIFQAAVDCQNWTPELEKPCYNSSNRNGLRYMRRGKLLEFINSDWLDMLLCWQTDITPISVCENLLSRLESNNDETLSI